MAPAATEKKRKLPARAAARVEQAAKKRHVASRDRSPTPEPEQPAKEPTPPPPPPSLPTSIQVGKPLPTVEAAQPDDLPAKNFQSISESGVFAESLSRSRQKWINDGLFEKYWTKPYKRKGILHEDPKNPPKDSMTRIGTVTITIEPHIVEATMFAVKANKPPPQSAAQEATPGRPPAAPTVSTPKQPPPPTPTRPVIQYGPPNGSMPPPPTPASTESTPIPVKTVPKSAAPQIPAGNQPKTSSAPASRQLEHSAKVTGPPAAASPGLPTGSSASKASSPAVTPRPPMANSPAPSPALTQGISAGRQPAITPSRQTTAPSRATPQQAVPANRSQPVSGQVSSSGTHKPSSVSAAAPANSAPKPAANDPVIALLALKASGDPDLRDLMKRVAVGQARDGELARFQKIIDQLNIECRQKNQLGPPADKLIVDGRTVKYFADEVRTILDIVLASNPNQKSTELRPPAGSDALVVLLVKTALEDQRTTDMIRRIAEGRPGYTDAHDLKELLDRLHGALEAVPKQPPPPPQTQPKQPVPNGVPNGHGKVANSPAQQASTQASRGSKGPAPTARPDISAVVFDFGSGDRYLFPKYSILEFLPTQSGQQVIASFLIVRKGSSSEYGGDPTLDYYQPVTIRLSTNSGRHLENLARIVAPQDEVRRYMDDVMDNMTRAEYVLLAMRLPRPESDGEQNASQIEEESRTGYSTPRSETEPDKNQKPRSGVLWTCSHGNNKTVKSQERMWDYDREHHQRQYEKLVRMITRATGAQSPT